MEYHCVVELDEIREPREWVFSSMLWDAKSMKMYRYKDLCRCSCDRNVMEERVMKPAYQHRPDAVDVWLPMMVVKHMEWMRLHGCTTKNTRIWSFSEVDRWMLGARYQHVWSVVQLTYRDTVCSGKKWAPSTLRDVMDHYGITLEVVSNGDRYTKIVTNTWNVMQIVKRLVTSPDEASRSVRGIYKTPHKTRQTGNIDNHMLFV